MNEDTLYLVAIGGTGMRCLESFVHLCAIGLFDSKEVNILMLDTDGDNGNQDRTFKLIELYNKIKSTSDREEDRGGKSRSNTFFSAKLNLTMFAPKYSLDANYKSLAQISNEADETVRVNRDLAKLFLSSDAQSFHLKEGYRAQTHLGSHLMYLAIVNAVSEAKKKGNNAELYDRELKKYIESVGENDRRRVFLFGSIFGGTGASSIPVLPRAFAEALKLTTGKEISAKFGASLLTEYFKFNNPSEAQRKRTGQNVIADSNYFTLNSQAALQFYQHDKTVEKNYKSLYNVGWPVEPNDFSQKNSAETITGGQAQKNPCHVTELMCAFAAHHFFTTDDLPKSSKPDFYFRTIEFKNNAPHFSFEDMVDSQNVAKLKNAVAGFYSIALMTLVYHGGAGEKAEGITGWVDRAKSSRGQDGQQVANSYDEIDSHTKKLLNDYFKSFLFMVDSTGQISNGWLYQLKASFNGDFLLPESAFGSTWQQIKTINPGTILPDAPNQWGKKKGPLGIFAKEPTDLFVEEFIAQHGKSTDNQGNASAKERLIAQLYNTVTSLQKVITN